MAGTRPTTAPILFLDIDGVIRHGREAHSSREPYSLPAEKIALLNGVVGATGAVTVVSSTWRLDEDCRDRLAKAGFVGTFHEDWKTPNWWDLVEIYGRDALGDGLLRGHEIGLWLRRHPDVATYAILDDNSDMLADQIGRLVLTSFMDGLEDCHAAKIVALLGGPSRPVPAP